MTGFGGDAGEALDLVEQRRRGGGIVGGGERGIDGAHGFVGPVVPFGVGEVGFAGTAGVEFAGIGQVRRGGVDGGAGGLFLGE